MRLRIIAYGVAVLTILTVVSLATFWIMGTVSPDAEATKDALRQRLEAADPPTRRRLLDEALDQNIGISIYAPDGSLLGTNVHPPLPPVRHLPPSPLQEDADHDEATPALVVHDRQPSPLDALGPSQLDIHAGRVRPTSDGVRIVIQHGVPRAKLLTPFAIPILVSTVGLVLLSFPVTRAMTHRLHALADAAQRFGKGDLGQRVDASGSDEVARTAQAFNMMAERIGELRTRERELFANVSHELRAPMARIAVLLELIEQKPSEARRYVAELGRDLAELESLLDGIIETFRLDLASPRAQEVWPLRKVSIDLRALVRDVAEDFRVRAPDHHLTLALEGPPVVREVDRTLLRRAVMNLLDNARKYSPTGSEIHAAVESSGAILVRDGGEGIDADNLPYVFDPFYRVDRSRARATGGVGLGLTFVKQVAALHDGSVSVTSEPGTGSEFRIVLDVS